MIGVLLVAAAVLFAVAAWKGRASPPLMWTALGLLVLDVAPFVIFAAPGIRVDVD